MAERGVRGTHRLMGYLAGHGHGVDVLWCHRVQSSIGSWIPRRSPRVKVTNMGHPCSSAMAPPRWRRRVQSTHSIRSPIACSMPARSINHLQVTEHGHMFYGAAAFNQPIGSWDTSAGHEHALTCSQVAPPRSINPSARGIPHRSRTWWRRRVEYLAGHGHACSMAPPRSINPSARGQVTDTCGCSKAPPRSINPSARGRSRT